MTKFKKITYTLAIIVMLFYLIAATVALVSRRLNNPSMREKSAIKFLLRNETQLLKYAKLFNSHRNLVGISYYENIFTISYISSGNVEAKDSRQIIDLILDFEQNTYYIKGGDSFETLEDAFMETGITLKDFEEWRGFLTNNNLYGIHWWDYPNIYLVFSRLGQLPRGLIYVPEGDDKELSHLKAISPGRARGSKTCVFDIITYIKGRWFYYEGP